MNQATWGHILRTAVVGTERGPLPAAVSQSLGLNANSDPAQTLLEALAAGALARKAGHPLVSGSVRHSSFLAALPALPAEVRPPLLRAMAGESTKEGHRPPSTVHPPPSTVSRLPEILHGRYAPLLGEWLALVAQHGLPIPPEYLPELLDRAERDPAFWEKLHPAVGARGAWLAAQNPAWQSLCTPADTSPDWFTANFETRLRLLAAARRDRPLVALAWLEKTWAEESNEHRLAFLAAVRTGLSVLDEDFLEKTFAAKSREVRRAAAELLAMLPESRRCTAWSAMARDWGGFVKTEDFAAFLTQKIPDVGEGEAAGLFALTDGKDLRSARQTVLHTLLRLLPPTAWGFGPPYTLLRDLLQDPERDFALPALLEATARHRDADWTVDWLRFLHERPEHPLWRSAHLLRLLSDLDEPLRETWLPLFCQHLDTLAYPESALYRTLTTDERLWPARLTHAVLAFWETSARRPFAYPTPQLRAVLDRAALRCRPTDAEPADAWLLPDDPAARLPQPWLQGAEALVDVVKFRREMVGRMYRETPVSPVR